MSTSSSSGVTSTTLTPLQFTGISQFSSDYQAILTRADAIAQLPVRALQNQQITIEQQQIPDLAPLGTAATAVGSARSLNQQTFSALASSQIASSLQLLGNSTTGIGGLQQTFSSLTDPITGAMIQQQETQWAATVTNLTDQINTKNTQNQAREQTLNRLLQAADATSVELPSQQSILTASITSLNSTSYGYNTNAPSSA
jgi:hypothetical protein